MKKIALVALLAGAAFATPAAAAPAPTSVTGTITLTGHVDAKCFVQPDNGSTFSNSVDFTALDAADGTLRTGLDTAFGTKSFTVKCTSSNPNISVTANPLATGSGAPAAGYDNSIDYSASVAVTTTTGTTTVTDATGGAATTGAAGAPLKNQASNVNITTSGYHTDTATDLLVAGTYNGSIVVVISPA